MLPVLLAIFFLGIVAGLRTFTAPAVLWLMRHGGVWALVLGVLALLEYVADLYPKAPARTNLTGLIARLVSGAFVGWALAAAVGSSVAAGAIVGAIGAAAGAYAGLAIRLKAIATIGAVPAAILEDAVAIGLAVLVISRTAA